MTEEQPAYAFTPIGPASAEIAWLAANAPHLDLTAAMERAKRDDQKHTQQLTDDLSPNSLFAGEEW